MRVQKMAGIATIVAVAIAGLVADVADAAGQRSPTAPLAASKYKLARTDLPAAQPGLGVVDAQRTSARLVKGVTAVSDPLLDASLGAGDLKGAGISTALVGATPALFANVFVKLWTNPFNPDWELGETLALWSLDVTGDDTTDYSLTFMNVGGVLYGDVWLGSSTTHVCDAVPTYDSSLDAFGVVLPLTCIGNPKRVRMWAGMQYQSATALSQDYAPNVGWSSFTNSDIWPGTPGTPTTVAGPSSLKVTFARPANNLVPVTDYVVRYRNASLPSWVPFADGVGTGNTITITGLNSASKYIVQVAAKNSVGTGTFSAESVARNPGPALVRPSAPSKPLVTPGLDSIQLEWVPPANAGSAPITDYRVDVLDGSTWVTFTDGVSAATSATVTGIDPYRVVQVRVAAISSVGVGSFSMVSQSTPLQAPGAPATPSVSPKSGGLLVSWGAPASDGGTPVNGYTVQYRVTGSRSLARDQRIVGGGTTTIDTVPWQVQLQLGPYLCGGTLIDRQWVLTAAHCAGAAGVSIQNSFVHSDITNLSEMNAFNAIRVDSIVVHPSYNSATDQNDLALVHLVSQAAGTPIPLFTDVAGPAASTPAVVSGWGTTASGGSVSDQLKKADVTVLGGPADGCGAYQTADPNLANYFDVATMLCAGAVGTDTCQGDSGGPLVVDAASAPKIAGITSFGVGCADALYPGVYTRVSSYISWIRFYVGDPFSWTTGATTNCNLPAPGCTYAEITGLTDGQFVEVRVIPQNVVGAGPPSFVSSATVDPSTAVVPAAPTAIVATPLSGRVALTWTAPANPVGGPVVGYEVSRDNGVSWVTTGTSVPKFTFANLVNGTNYSFRIRALNVAGAGFSAGSATVKPSVYGYVGVNPSRLLATRSSGGAIVPAAPRALAVGGRAGIPTSVVAVALSVTVDTPIAAGSLTVWPCSATRPALPNVTFRAGQLSSQLVISRLGSLSRVCIHTTTPTHVVVDALGYYPTGSKFTPLTTTRLASGARAANSILQVLAANRPGIPAGAKAVALKITASGSTASGYVNVYSCSQTRPASWSLWFQPGKASSDTIYISPGADGKVCVVSNVAVTVAVDVVGYVPSVGMYVPTGPKRLVDSRGGTSDSLYSMIGPRAAGAGLRFKVLGRAGVPTDASSVALRVTVVAPAAAGYVTLWPCDAPKAGINVAFAAGQTFTGTVLTKIGGAGKVCMQATKPVDVVVDLDGYVPKL